MHGSTKDLPKTVDVNEITIFETDWEDIHVNFSVCHRTLDIAPVLKGLPEDLCQCPHWGMILKGRKVVKYRDHDEILNAGDAYYMRPGHSTVTEAGTEWVEFSPSNEFRKTKEAVERNLATLRQR
jgi:hypothetical protein